MPRHGTAVCCLIINEPIWILWTVIRVRTVIWIFFSSSYREEDIDKEWLTRVLKQRKDYYRQNRDLCIICMIGLYAVCMIDAYVDAQLYHFDVSPDISMKWQPAIIPTGRTVLPSIGLQCAITF